MRGALLSGDLSKAWPADQLEHLGACPVCGAPDREVLFADLDDASFQVAPGRWTLWRCGDCRAVYLDPRPNLASIGDAYGRYYTHGVPDPKRFVTRRMDLRSALGRGYLNRVYGYRLKAAVSWKIGKRLMSDRERTRLDYMIRHLKAPGARGASLLDVGCSNGGFLALARDLGFRTTGVEPDPKAVEAGRAAGLGILEGGLERPELKVGAFDHVTLSHVLEHLHDPRAALARILDLLKPGGRLWLSQPNLKAAGFARYGRDWRGLEVPRHMTLWEPDGLKTLLAEVGYVGIAQAPADRAAGYYFGQSAAMAEGKDPQTARPSDEKAVRALADAADAAAREDREKGESLTLFAFRPKV
jgi:SAM-dependent methyltransferase